MNKLLITGLALCFSLSANAIERTQSLAVIQNSTKDAWTANCKISAQGIDSNTSYWGDLLISYDDAAGQVVLATVRYFVGPGVTSFTESSPGLYAVSAKLYKTSIVVSIQATRYGPLYASTSYAGTPWQDGKFQCNAAIVEGTGPSGETVFWNVLNAFNGAVAVGRT